jgi:WD40 repeat protein
VIAGDYLSSFSLDNTWSLWDVASARRLCSVRGEEGFSCGMFHPDGIILGTGSSGDNGAIRIWDVREQTNVGSFTEHQGEITSLTFSENGYYMASAGVDCKVRIWDLRKLKCAKTIDSKCPSFVALLTKINLPLHQMTDQSRVSSLTILDCTFLLPLVRSMTTVSELCWQRIGLLSR